ncbi:hypothetical protein BSPA111_02320 [Buttiauxella sp. A111]|nr:hypothetical protein BSPA111_02320 [Buttiauxella sp. A111]
MALHGVYYLSAPVISWVLFPWVKTYMELIVLAFIEISLIPVSDPIKTKSSRWSK